MDNAYRFYALVESMKKNLYHNQHFINLTKGEFTMLHIIKMYEVEKNTLLTTAELSQKLHISKPAVSQMINVLEEKQYVKRNINQEDRRLISITLTELGNRQLEEEKHLFLNQIKQSLEEMGEKDSEQFISLLEKYYKIVKKMVKNNSCIKR